MRNLQVMASDRLDQARVVVLDDADARVDRPGEHCVGWIGSITR